MVDDLNHELPLPAFDRELNFQELLAAIDAKKLMASIGLILDSPFRIISSDKKLVLGDNPNSPTKSKPIIAEMEPIAYLEVNKQTDDQKVNAVKILLELILHSSARYLMTSDLHLRAIQEDFENLQYEHKALMESESRYRDLNSHLEERVAEQVKTIESAQRQLFQSEKMASVGQLAAGIAHEINNPIGFINSNLNIAKGYIKDFYELSERVKQAENTVSIQSLWQEKDLDFVLEDFKQLVDENIDGAARVAKIVKDLKDFSNIDHNQEELADINEIVQRVCNVAHNEIKYKAVLAFDAGDIPNTYCSPGFLAQAFINILLNAVKAVGENGQIEISTGLSDKQIAIRFKDNGVGIPEEIVDRIFDPFFTTNDIGQGTGLGLTVCRDIIQSHQGKISVESKPGVGTVFIITLPIFSLPDHN